MKLEEILRFRRAVRMYDRTNPIDAAQVKRCLELATLAPSSSNLQLWEFYHITRPELIARLAEACLGQKSVSTASQVVVFVVRRDLYKAHARYLLDFERGNVRRNSPADRQEKRIKDRELYYGRLVPFLYARCFGLLGLLRTALARVIGLFRPMMQEVSEADIRVSAHKSCALAAQTFMLAMAEEGLDTCPLEGFDSHRVKRLLSLPHGAEVSMVIPCGRRDGGKGVFGERCRLPFEEVYHRL